MKDAMSRRTFLKTASACAMGLSALNLLGPASIGLAEAEAPVEETEAAAAEAQAPQSELDIALGTEIYCIDRFVTKPDQGQEFLTYFMENYLEKAESYGMVLKSTMVAPPVWLDNASNTIEIVWAIAGFNGWAAMVNASRYNQETLDFWRNVRTRVVSHDRSFFGNESDLEVLGNV